jgi:Protein of unknown function (DUF3800)
MIPLGERDRRVLMTLLSTPHNAFFDESGTHDQSDLVVVGGLLATYESWARAEPEWNRVVGRKKDKDGKPLKVFHYTDFMARVPPFNWPTDERNDFMERLTTIIGENVALGIAYGIFREDYDGLPLRLRQEFKDIYHCCSYFCLDSLVKWKRTFKGPALPTPIEFLFDREKGFEGRASEIYYQVVKGVDGDGVLGDMGFGSKDKDIPLQMADLLVGAAARHFRRERKEGLSIQPDKAIQSLDRNHRMLLLGLRKDDIQAITESVLKAQSKS